MGKPSNRMISTILSCILLSSLPPAAEAGSAVINGAGASFPFPVYSQWAFRYNRMTGVKINYQSIGSGGGIAQIKVGTVDFGATDAPLHQEDLAQFDLLQFPLIMGAVVPVVNIRGIDANQIKLTPQLLADIFLGRITRWNDEAIEAVNPDLQLPEEAITVVHRADGSGSTWLFTHYLDKTSPEWHASVGSAESVHWPVGVGAKGNEGVSVTVQRIEGAVGYVEYAYAYQNNLKTVLLRNRAGRFIAPTQTSFQAAASTAGWEDTTAFCQELTNQAGEDTWPIFGASYILIQKQQPDPEKSRDMLAFFHWCYRYGERVARNLTFIPMPERIVERVEENWREFVRSNGKRVWE